MTTDTGRLIIAGGGLSGCLAALGLKKLRPEVPLLLLEAGSSFGGNHTWSFFDADVAADARWLIDPLIGARWPAYDIRFPRRSRTLHTAYNSVTSDRLDEVMRKSLRSDQYRLECPVDTITPDRVILSTGETLLASSILDARGPGRFAGLELGWQKFLGREYRFDRPHGLERPIVMDAMVDQTDGYRFVYCLPFSTIEMLVEDTYYSLSPTLDADALGSRIETYVSAQGWEPAELVREEKGVLPVATGGSVEGLWKDDPGVPRIGLRGGFFHPTTGYSLPDAVRIALLVARQSDLAGPALHQLLHDKATKLWRERRFYRLLNRMLFHAAAPDQRYRVLEHFYRLDAGLIARFYAGRSGVADKLRILSGRPPVPVGKALVALRRQGRKPG